jgi:PAS domain S-box-containing protein
MNVRFLPFVGGVDILYLRSLVFTQAVDPILIEDVAGIVVDLNEEAVRSYGWSREELIGNPIKTLVPPERHDQADDLLARCKAGNEVRNIGCNCTFRENLSQELFRKKIIKNGRVKYDVKPNVFL